MRQTLTVVIAATSLLCVTELAAQDCIGLPLGASQTALTGNIAFADQTTTLGGQISRNANGPLAYGAGGGIVLADGGNGVSANGAISHDVTLSNLNACIVSGLQFTGFSTEQSLLGVTIETDAKLFVLPIGLGIGKNMPVSPTLGLILSGAPQLLLVRSSFDVESNQPIPPTALEGSDTDLEFALNLGGTLVSSKLFGGLFITLSSMDSSDVVFTLNVGTILGRR